MLSFSCANVNRLQKHSHQLVPVDEGRASSSFGTIYLGNSNPAMCVQTCGVFFLVHHRAPFFDNGGKLDG